MEGTAPRVAGLFAWDRPLRAVCLALVLGAVWTHLSLAPAAAQQPDRAQYSFKGDLFVWPYVKIRWRQSDQKVLLDTFITLVNDDVTQRKVRFYYVEGNTWAHPATDICLTGNQPTYFSAFSGRGGLVCPTVPPDFPPASGAVPFRIVNFAGLPDGPSSAPNSIRKAEGFIVGWTVDENLNPVGTNQIAGGATVVDYENEAGWAYRAWSFRSNFLGPKPDPTVLRLNGAAGEYQPAPCKLLVDFWKPGTNVFCAALGAGTPQTTPCSQDFELTLVNMVMDFRRCPDNDFDGTTCGDLDDPGPPTNEILIASYNASGSTFIGNATRCIQCWDNNLASTYPATPANPFAINSDKGTAVITCGPPNLCVRPASSPHSQMYLPPIVPVEMPFVGVAHKIISWSGPARVEKAASVLTVVEERTDGFILFDSGDQSTVASLIDPLIRAVTEVGGEPSPPGPRGRP